MAESPAPNTHPSLLVRVKDPSDQQAWSDFVEIYWPVVYRLARHKGLQHADAEDLTQQVLAAVAKAIKNWHPDEKRARFRSWLFRIAQNQIINAVTRIAADRGSGDSGIHRRLAEQPSAGDSQFLATEYRREVFRWAARQIQVEFQPLTWQAFWLTAVEGRNVEEVAEQLHMTRGALYAARSRVMRRLKDKVRQREDT